MTAPLRTTPILGAVLLACGGVEDPAENRPDRPMYDPFDFASAVVQFAPGEGAGFGQSKLPEVVVGPPSGRGMSAGSLDVLSLGDRGSITLAFATPIIDGPGADLIVFENAFKAGDGTPFIETARVAASADGETFVEWPCAATDAGGLFAGCAGVSPTFAFAQDGSDALDPDTSGGDAFDLARIGLVSARFVRITDTGLNVYQAPSGGFDLDAVAVVHRAR